MGVSKALLMKFTVNGSITKYISTEAVSRSIFYSPQIVAPPSFELSGDGYVAAGFGSFSIVNNPYDEESVFNYKQGTYPALAKGYQVSFEWGEQNTPLFSGTAILRGVTDTELQFDLINPEFSQDLLVFTQDETRVTVDSTADALGGSGNEVRVTSTGHGLQDNSEVIFEGLTTTTGLNYDETDSTVYSISVVDTNTFDLLGTDSDNFTLGVEGAGKAGNPVIRPMAFGRITYRIPEQKSTTLVSNPYLDITETSDDTSVIRVQEDGVEIANNITGDPNVFITPPTATTLTLNAGASGEVSVSGKSIQATTLEGFFSFVATELGLTLDSTKATTATNVVLSFFVNTQIKNNKPCRQYSQGVKL